MLMTIMVVVVEIIIIIIIIIINRPNLKMAAGGYKQI
jgi:hypothetical protein